MSQDVSGPDVIPDLWKDNIWDRLLDSLDERSVVPIIGPDLLQVQHEGIPISFDRLLAIKLAQNYALPLQNLPHDRPLNYVVCQLLRQGQNRDDLSYDIFQIMKKTELPPCKPLAQLAEITHFNLFVTTTSDSLLERAINDVRFGGVPETQAIAYSPKKIDDLPGPKERLQRPTVYYLMGKVAATGNYVISEEDLLEFVCDLQTPARRPELLFDELKKNHLLILGENFSDWLARVFLRTAKGGRLSAMRDVVEIVADQRTHSDANLVSFLHNFSRHTRVFRAGGAVEFVDELWKRWRERHPKAPLFVENLRDLPRREMPKNAIFISYAREDLDAVRELKTGLDAAGLTVWFDIERLKAGDNFNPQIEQYISKECCCFVPIISANTERRLEAYFRREWNLAVERDKSIHFQKRFIVPVIIDDTRSPSAIPARFSELHYTCLPDGNVTPAFVAELKSLVAS
jgi:TIR domain/SIR2-like domain